MPDIKRALTVLQRAISNEITGQRFYDDAARYCIDLWAKEVFATLARDEEEHTQLLLVEHEALRTKGYWIDLETARASDAEFDISGFRSQADEPGEALFPPRESLKEMVDRKMDDMAALAFGIEMEQRAIELYGQQAKATDDPAARATYEFLVQEETRHRYELRAQWEKLAGTAFEGS